MALIGWLELGEALAESENGELTVSPLPGLLTVTLASAGIASAVQMRNEKKVFIEPAFLKNWIFVRLQSITKARRCNLGRESSIRQFVNGLI